MNAFINEVKLDTCNYGSLSLNSNVTEHPLENKQFSDIVSHIDNKPLDFSITCSLSGDDRESRYQALLDMRLGKEIVYFNYFRAFDDLLITNITNVIDTTNVIELQISFKQIQYATVEQAPIALDSVRLDLKAQSDAGKQGTTENPDIQQGGITFESN